MPRSASVKIQVSVQQRSSTGTAAASVGRSVNKYRTSDFGELPEFLAGQLRDTVTETNRSFFFQKKAPELAAAIAEGINRELLKVGQFMATHLIGITSGTENGGSTAINVFDKDAANLSRPEKGRFDVELEWRNLANITVRKKTANKRKFFLHTTQLREELKAKAGRGLVNLNQGFKTGGSFKGGVAHGPVRIRPSYYQNEKGQRIYKIADIEVNLLSQVQAPTLLGVVNQRVFTQSQNNVGDMPALARMMGLSEEAIAKLSGGVIDRHRIRRRNRSAFKIGRIIPQYADREINMYRPMLEPTLAYFFQVRVPRSIERVIGRYRRSGILKGSEQ